MPSMEIGGGGGDQIAGMPRKYVLIGAGVLGVGAILLLQRSKGGSSGGDGNTVTPGLGPNASLALGGVQNEMLRQSGELQVQLRDYFDELGTHLDGNAAALGDQITDAQGNIIANTGAWGGLLANHGQQIQDLITYFGWKNPNLTADAIAFPDGFAAAKAASAAAQQQQSA